MFGLIASWRRRLLSLEFVVAGFLLILSGLAPSPFTQVEPASEILAQASAAPSAGCDNPFSSEGPGTAGAAIRISSAPCQPREGQDMLAIGQPGLKLEPIIDQPNADAPRTAQPIAF